MSCWLPKFVLFFLPVHNAPLNMMIFQIPDNLSFDQASTIPLGLAATAVGFYQKKKEGGGLQLVAPWAESGRGRYAGQAMFITGGSSSVGQYGTHLVPRPLYTELDVDVVSISSPVS
jgi:hypothetical protein